MWGAGLAGLADFHPRYRNFRNANKGKKIYFASVDIRKCYDNIQLAHMLKLVMSRNCLSGDDYRTQRCHLYSRRCDLRLKRTTVKRVGSPSSFVPFDRLLESFANAASGPAVSTGPSQCDVSNRLSLKRLICEHLEKHIVKVAGRYGERYLVQACGIPQGSIISSFLCNLYYGNIEDRLLKELIESMNNLLVRLVDDFLFVTTDLEELRKFLRIMEKGCPELGVNIHAEKTAVSTGIDGRRQFSLSGRKFPWCGYLLDMDTGEVSIDYRRFEAVSDSLTIDRAGREGERLQWRMQSFVRPRCIAILFDSDCVATVAANYYQMMLMGAAKTMKYLSGLHNGLPNICYVLSCIDDLSSYALRLVYMQLQVAKKGTNSDHDFVLSRRTTNWLCWRAFRDVANELPHLTQLSYRINLVLQKMGHHAGLHAVIAEAWDQFNIENVLA